MSESVFKITLESNYDYTVELGYYEKLGIIQFFKHCYDIQVKMGAWLDNPEVPAEKKEKFTDQYLRLTYTLSWTMNLMKSAGIPEQEIKEMMNVPF